MIVKSVFFKIVFDALKKHKVLHSCHLQTMQELSKIINLLNQITNFMHILLLFVYVFTIFVG
jgi:hypothetical protein